MVVKVKRNVLGIIPARGGSKGIPMKNVKSLLGKPLIVWSIEAAQNSKLIDRFVVSTEDKQIKEIALKYGVEVIDRPKEFAEDTSTTWSVLYHVLTVLKPDYIPDAIVLLEPTSPVRSNGIIDKCIEKFFEKNYDSLVTGYISKQKPYGSKPERRQDIKGVFYHDGTVYVIKPEIILHGSTIGKKWGYVISSREEHVDIDEEYDFWLAEQTLKRLKHIG